MSRSSGVLCFMKNNDRTYFVLGREQFDKTWDASLTWCDFGGRVKMNESDMDAAFRELCEESLGCIQRHMCKPPITTITINSETFRTLYVCEIPWDPYICRQFQTRRKRFKRALSCVIRLRKVSRKLCDMGFPVPDRPLSCCNNQFVTSIGPLDIYKSDTGQQYAILQYATTMPFKMLIYDLSIITDYMSIIEWKNELERLLGSFPKEIINDAITYDISGNLKSWLPFIRRDYLEKDRIQLVDLENLQNGLDTIKLRNSFVLPLYLALQAKF